MSNKLGRNDPCHCGSGKKYKHCHREVDFRSQKHKRAGPELAAVPLDLKESAAIVSARVQRDHAAAGKDLKELFGESEALTDFLSRLKASEAATDKLEPYRHEFEKLIFNEEARLNKTRSLFAEACFAPLRFSAEEVQKAFEKVGYPGDDDRTVGILRQAMLFLATELRRLQLAAELVACLPEFVDAGRYLDGWMIQHCAAVTVELIDEANPFLFEMFAYGYEAWAEKDRATKAALFSELEVDLARMKDWSLDEIEAWMAKQKADPQVLERVNAVINEHSEDVDRIAQTVEQAESAFLELLEREEGRPLLLSAKEVESWIPVLSQRFAAVDKAHPEIARKIQTHADIPAAAVKQVLVLFGEMAGAIFTPDRIQTMVSQFRKVASQLFETGYRRSGAIIMSVLPLLEEEKDPGSNIILTTLCFTSVKYSTDVMATGEG